MSHSEPRLTVDNISKKYARKLSTSLQYGARDLANELLGRRNSSQLRPGEFWALKDVSFDLRKGDCLGVLGANGAGKTTLLKTITGILKPDMGEVRVTGRVARIIALSAGFRPEMTGRENVELRTRFLGLSRKELEKKLEEVNEFTELGDFMDMPVQNYSSGMKARLGFAVSTLFSPDVLVVDEVLAVGDLSFRMKCYDRLDQLRYNAVVVFVSHSLTNISRICNVGCFLKNGRVAHYGDVQESIRLFQNDILQGKSQNVGSFRPERLPFSLLTSGSPLGNRISFGAPLSVRVSPTGLESGALFRIVVSNQSGERIIDWNSVRSDFRWNGMDPFSCELGPMDLCPGKYYVSVVAYNDRGHQLALSNPIEFLVSGEYHSGIAVQRLGKWRHEEISSHPDPLGREAGAAADPKFSPSTL